jgi:HK97 family phage portal protein
VTIGELIRAPGRWLTKALLLPLPSGRTGGGVWSPVVRESFPGAWQRNITVSQDAVLAYFAVYACITLIASDISKLCLRLVEETADDIWEETDSPAFSPVLRKPNRYQTIHKFIEQWVTSKLVQGNTYILKERDARTVVVAMYVLDPTRVQPLVAPDGAVYYKLQTDVLTGQPLTDVTVPASEIIHDTMVTLFHPLVGVSPIFACGLSATQGLTIQHTSAQFFANGAAPGGLLYAPTKVSEDEARRIKAQWTRDYRGTNSGLIALLDQNLKYEPLTMPAHDAQLIEQLKWTAENVCSCYHVPPYMVGIGPPPPYANVEPLVQLYYSQCLQSLITNLEACLDEGLGIETPIQGTQYGTEFDIDDLIWMDAASRAKAATDAAGTLAPNETRAKYYGLGPVPGGDSPMVQQQYYSLEALAARDAGDPFATSAPPPVVPPAPPPDQMSLDALRTTAATRFRQKAWAA